MVRGRLQRPKPNLSRAVGKKCVPSQGKADTESKSLHPETSVEKVWNGVTEFMEIKIIKNFPKIWQ